MIVGAGFLCVFVSLWLLFTPPFEMKLHIMENKFSYVMLVIAAVVAVTPATAQTARPDFSGIWQANTTANWLAIFR